MKTFRLSNIKVETDHMKVDVRMDRFEGQYAKAQYLLDSMIMTHMIPLMPKVTSGFINRTFALSQSIAGSGYVYAAAPPYGRFLYEGKTMVSPTTGSTYAAYGEKKVLVSMYQGKTNAKEDLDLTKGANPDAKPKWFEEAKKLHGKNWVKMAKKIAGGD